MAKEAISDLEDVQRAIRARDVTWGLLPGPNLRWTRRGRSAPSVENAGLLGKRERVVERDA